MKVWNNRFAGSPKTVFRFVYDKRAGECRTQWNNGPEQTNRISIAPKQLDGGAVNNNIVIGSTSAELRYAVGARIVLSRQL